MAAGSLTATRPIRTLRLLQTDGSTVSVPLSDLSSLSASKEDICPAHFSQSRRASRAMMATSPDGLGEFGTPSRVGEVRVSRPRAYYGANSAASKNINIGELYREAIDLAQKGGADFSAFVVGGRVPLTVLLHAGPGEHDSAMTWYAGGAARPIYDIAEEGTGGITFSFLQPHTTGLSAPTIATTDDAHVYSLDGRLVKWGNAPTGIYLQHGKKIIVR